MLKVLTFRFLIRTILFVFARKDIVLLGEALFEEQLY